jgi:hypothetical protein
MFSRGTGDADETVILEAVTVLYNARVNDVSLTPQLADAPVHLGNKHHLFEVTRADAIACLVTADVCDAAFGTEGRGTL